MPALRGLLLALAVLLLAVPAASAKAHSCRPLPHHSRVVARDYYAVVVIAPGKVSRTSYYPPGANARSYYYCSRQMGWQLAANTLPAPQSYYHVRLRGKYLALDTTLDNVMTGQSSAGLGGAIAPNPPLFSANGVLAYIRESGVCGSPAECHAVYLNLGVVVVTTSYPYMSIFGPAASDEPGDISRDMGNLSLYNSGPDVIVTWTDDGIQHTATITP